jgi:hypothetical protein
LRPAAHPFKRRLVTMLVRLDVADFLDEVSRTSGMELLLEQIQVAAGSSLAGFGAEARVAAWNMRELQEQLAEFGLAWDSPGPKSDRR